MLGDGKPATDKVEIDLYARGGAAPFNTVAAGETLKLQPGKVRMVARLLERTLDDGTSLSGEATVSVPAGGAVSPSIELAAARLDVVTTVGKKPQALEVSLVAVGAEAAAAKKRTDVEGAASFSISAGKYNVRAALLAPQGEVVTQKQITVRAGARLGLKLDLDIGTANVQVFDGGVAVPAEVRFYTELKAGKPDGEPFLAVPASTMPCPQRLCARGQAQGASRLFSEIRVAADAPSSAASTWAPKRPTRSAGRDRR